MKKDVLISAPGFVIEACKLALSSHLRRPHPHPLSKTPSTVTHQQPGVWGSL